MPSPRRSSEPGSWRCCRTSEDNDLSSPFRIRRRVEFRDTDAAGIVHFSVFFVYMEQAEHAMLRQLGVRVVESRDGATLSWPRVSAKCDYLRPARFDEELDIEVTVARIGTKSVTYQFEFSRLDERIAHGTLIAACCEVAEGAIPVPVPVPQDIVDRLLPFSSTA